LTCEWPRRSFRHDDALVSTRSSAIIKSEDHPQPHAAQPCVCGVEREGESVSVSGCAAVRAWGSEGDG
jgi:hypothetical protein